MKSCPNCGNEIHKVRNTYCNNKCQLEFERKQIYEMIENNQGSFYQNTYKAFLISKYGNKCMECGWDKINQVTGKIPIQLEHIDGDSENNNLENLKLLCPNCHSLTPTYGALNKGKGRKNRKR